VTRRDGPRREDAEDGHDLLLAEELLLLSLDDEKGSDQTWSSRDPGLAGARLLELMETGSCAWTLVYADPPMLNPRPVKISCRHPGGPRAPLSSLILCPTPCASAA